MKLFLWMLNSKNVIQLSNHIFIFICGIVKIWKLQIFAEFSTRASDLDKKNFVENLGRYYAPIRIFSEWGLHRWCYGGSFSRFWPPRRRKKTKCRSFVSKREGLWENKTTSGQTGWFCPYTHGGLLIFREQYKSVFNIKNIFAEGSAGVTQ